MHSQTRLKKALEFRDVYVLALGPMLSSGFFLLPGLASSIAGPAVVVAYLVGSALMVPAMLSQSELASAMPRAGGTYYFLDRSLGPIIGTVGGIGTWLVLVLKAAFALIGLGAYLAILVHLPYRPVAIGLTLLVGLLAYFGTGVSGRVQRYLVLSVLGFLAVFLIGGSLSALQLGREGTLQARMTPFFATGVEGLAATAGLVFISYAGLTKVASLSEEVKDPERNIPLGMILALLTAAVIYAIGVFLMVATVEPDLLHGDLTPVASAGAAIFARIPRWLLIPAIILPALAALASAANAAILSASRYPLAMARDGLVPELLGHLGRFRTPTFAILLTVACAILALSTLDVLSVAKLASTFQLLVFALLCLAVIIMRESGLAAYDPGYRAPLYPFLQVVGFIAPFLLIAAMGIGPILFAAALVAVGIVWYHWYARAHITREGAVFHWFERLGQRRDVDLDSELRIILKEKGLRAEDPLEEVVARSFVLDLAGEVTYEEATREAAERLADRVRGGRDHIAEELLRGSLTGATPVSHGAALPHFRTSGAERPELVLARSLTGIPVIPPGGEAQLDPDRTPDSTEPVHAVFFLVSPRGDNAQHLRMLAAIAEQVDSKEFWVDWNAAEGENALRAAVIRHDRFVTLRIDPDGMWSALAGRPLRDVHLPRSALVALIRRHGRIVVPHGDTILELGDRLSIVGEPDDIRELREPEFE
jgi:amino acid transporter/mannitol/fructose-specific phosphotransferase system IIA component (Ntr-type)